MQPAAQLVTFGLTLTFQHYSHLPTYEIYYLDEPALKTLASAAQPLYVLLNLDNVETQWQDRRRKSTTDGCNSMRS